MADAGYQKPSNAILIAGEPLKQTLKVETVTNMYAGRLVKKGTNDDDIVVNTAGGKAIGWLGYEQTHKKYRPATVDTLYTQNDQAAVLNGGKFVVVGSLKDGETVVKGDALVGAANGEVALATALAVPSGTTAVTSTGAQPSISGTLGSEGPIVGYAEESKAASGSSEDLSIRSAI